MRLRTLAVASAPVLGALAWLACGDDAPAPGGGPDASITGEGGASSSSSSSSSSGGGDGGAAPFPCEPGDGGWRRCPDNPLYLAGKSLPSGDLEISVGDPDVFFDEDDRTWKAWWSTGAAKTFAQAEGAPIHVKYAESKDGVHWTVQAEPAMTSGVDPQNWDDSQIETPSVVKVPGNPPDRRYVMYYAGANYVDYPKKPGADFAWYQIGVAFSPDGKKFTRLPAAESPYAGKATGFRKHEGLLLLGKDAFPGVANVEEGLVADPEIVVANGTFHLFFSSYGTRADRTTLAGSAYGTSVARSTDGVHFTVANGNPRWVGDTQPSVIKVGAAWELYTVRDSAEDFARVPTSFNPYYGIWKRTSADLETWSDRGASHDFVFDPSVASERYGWVKAGDVAYRDGIRRYYYVAFGDQNVPPGFATILRPDAGVPLPDGSIDLGAAGVVVPAVIGLHVAARR